MSVEQDLKTLILEHYKSIRAFPLELNIPYSTIDTMLKRGVSGTAVSTVLRICHALQIDADSLLNGKIEEKQPVSTIKYSLTEEKHIKKYRTLDEYGKKNVDTILDNEYERCNKDEKDLIVLRDIKAESEVPKGFHSIPTPQVDAFVTHASAGQLQSTKQIVAAEALADKLRQKTNSK